MNSLAVCCPWPVPSMMVTVPLVLDELSCFTWSSSRSGMPSASASSSSRPLVELLTLSWCILSMKKAFVVYAIVTSRSFSSFWALGKGFSSVKTCEVWSWPEHCGISLGTAIVDSLTFHGVLLICQEYGQRGLQHVQANLHFSIDINCYAPGLMSKTE